MKYIIILLILFSPFLIISQDISYKLGDVSKEELLMDSCEFYSNADAVVLFNIGNVRIEYNNTMGFIYQFEMHQRIKILTKAGKKYANRKIRYYKGKVKRFEDKISGFKAYTYNLEGDKITKTKLTKKEKYYNELNDYRQELSFVMPNVKKGSVIEIKYKLTSRMLGSLKTWYFQDKIPVKYSNFWYAVPELLKYQVNNYGNYFPKETKDKYRTMHVSDYSVNETGKEFTMKNITPLEEEPYMGNSTNALSRIEFNLVYINSDYGYNIDIGTTYEKLNENLAKDFMFGKRLSKGRFSKKWKKELSGKSDYEKLEFILKKIQNNTNWDKHYHFLSEISGGTLYKKKEGDIADINLTLIAALKYHGLKVYPVILRTRDKGIPNPVYPDKWSFNYVIALVEIDGKEILCDATLDTPPGLIRKECINNKGWLVDKKGGRWIDLTKDAFKTVSILYNSKIRNDSIVNDALIQFKDYFAYDINSAYENGGLEKHFRELLSDWEIENLSFEDSNNSKVFKVKLKFKKEIEDEDLILIDPFPMYVDKENPFKREKRNSVMDFIFKQNYNMVFNMETPKGYNVEVPGNIQLKTEDNSINYLYIASKTPQKAAFINKLRFKKTMFAPTEYDIVKTFFEKITSSNNSTIVLKKQ